MNGRLVLSLVNATLFAIAFVLAMLSPRPLFFWLGFLWCAAAIFYVRQAWRECRKKHG